MKIEITELERPSVKVRIVGPHDQGKRIIMAIFDMGGRVERSGPYTNEEMFPKMDIERFLFIAWIPVDSYASLKKTLGGAA